MLLLQDVIVVDDVVPSIVTLTIPKDVIVFPVPVPVAVSVHAAAVKVVVVCGTRGNVLPVEFGKDAVVAAVIKSIPILILMCLFMIGTDHLCIVFQCSFKKLYLMEIFLFYCYF